MRQSRGVRSTGESEVVWSGRRRLCRYGVLRTESMIGDVGGVGMQHPGITQIKKTRPRCDADADADAVTL
jgi:hypothetical protein